MNKEINFDMDGTIADFYGVDGWLDSLLNEDVRPYAIAKPLINMNVLARVLNKLIDNGYKVNIISWGSKNSSEEFLLKVTTAKIQWLNKHLHSVNFNAINVLPYGEPKENYGNGILFDDEIPNRNNWNGIAYDEKNIIEILKGLI